VRSSEPPLRIRATALPVARGAGSSLRSKLGERAVRTGVIATENFSSKTFLQHNKFSLHFTDEDERLSDPERL